MIIAIFLIITAVILALFVSKYQSYKQLEQDYQKLKSQQEQMREPVFVDDVDNHQLDKESEPSATMAMCLMLTRTGLLLWCRANSMS